MVRGETQYNPVSRFLKEIPPQLLDQKLPNTKTREYTAYDDASHERAAFLKKPYGMAAKPQSAAVKPYNVITKPKAVAKPKETRAEVKPFIARGTSMFGRKGITRGVQVPGEKPDYEVGDRVRHVKFGQGTVKALEKGARDYQVTVEFDQYGQKILFAAFARLQKL